MRCAKVDIRRHGGASAALLAAALVLSGCSSASTPPADPDTGSTSRFTTLFSGSPSPAAQTVAGSPGFNADDCPNVDVRNGAGALTMSGKPPADASTDVRYQLNITQVARQCSSSGGNLVMKVGVQGRIIVGPIGGSGQVDIPLRYAVVREGVTPKTIATKFKRVPADVPSGQSNVGFSDVEESLSFPIPSRAELPAYMVYVGFDEIGDGPEKKPAAKKPAPKKPVPKSQ
jgi:putative transposon-encoded protein